MAISATVSVHALKVGGDKHHLVGFVNGILTRGASPRRDGNSPPAAATTDKICGNRGGSQSLNRVYDHQIPTEYFLRETDF